MYLRWVTLDKIRKVSRLSQHFFKNLSARHLELVLISDHTEIDREMFRNLGQVDSLKLDVSRSASQGNSSLVRLEVPVDKQGGVFLQKLSLGRKKLSCACHNIG